MQGLVFLNDSKISICLEEYGFRLFGIQKATKISFAALASIDKKICKVILLSKNLILLRLFFELDQDALWFYSAVEKAMNSICFMEQLPAFGVTPEFPVLKGFDPMQEYNRMLVNTNQWRFSSINANFTVKLVSADIISFVQLIHQY